MTRRRGRVPGVILLVAWAVCASGPFQPVHAVETGRLVEKDGRYVFVESQDPAIKLLMERALKQGVITKEEYERVVKESEERAYLLQPSFKAWYDRGFNFSVNDNAFFLKLRARFQGRMTQRFRNEAWRNPGDAKNFPELLGVFGDYRANRSEQETTSFNLRRLRLYAMGHLFNPDFKYFIQIRGETAENAQAPGSLQLLDWSFASSHVPWLNVQLGQYKVFFNRAQINSTASMQFAERALVMDAFTASGLDRRDIGLTVLNDEELYPVNYYVGLFNGNGPSFNRLGSFVSEGPQEGTAASPAQRNINANTRLDVDRLMLAGRLNWNVMGRPGYGEGDLVYSETPQVAVGGGYAYNPAINTSTNNGGIGIDLANLNNRRQLATFGNGRQLGNGIIDYSTWTLDAVAKYRGWSMQGEYYFKNVDRHDKGKQLGHASGWYAQGGYYLIPRKLELAARYAYWDPDTNAAGDLIKEVSLAASYYFQSTYDHKVVLEFSNTAMGTGGFAEGRSAPLPAGFGGTPLDAVGGTLVENRIRVQYEIFF